MIEQSSSMIQDPKDIEIKREQHEGLWKLSLTALLYKNVTLYRKNYCSNLCQILTPLLCLAFTLVVRMVTEQVTTGKVGFFPFPQPFHMPLINKMIPGLKMNCSQKYYYSFPINDSQISLQSQHLFKNVLKIYCSQTQGLTPEFIFSEDPNERIIQELRVTDHTKIERGVDMQTSLPDGKIVITNLTKDNFNALLSINDWRLPEYHKNNGVTKLDLHTENQMIVTYLKVTQGLMSLIQKLTRSYLQIFGQNQIIVGNYMYMPFDGVDKSLMSKATNVIGSGLYGLGLSLLLPIFLYSIVSQKEERLIQIMKMNGLLMKYYWIAFFIFNFTLSLLSGCFLFAVGNYVLDISFFSETSWQVLFLLFIGWSISQVSLTAFVQIFINNSKTATIIGYVLSIFSCLVGQAVSNVVYPFPSTLPVAFLFFPPWALTRGIYLIGYACANNSNCFQDIRHLSSQMYTVYFCLFAWIAVFIFSTYLHEMIQQEYGTSKLPSWLNKLLKSDKTSKIEQNFQMCDLPRENNMLQVQQEQNNLFDISNEHLNELSASKIHHEEIDSSIIQVLETTLALQPQHKPLIIKKLHKIYDNGHEALKQNSFYLEEKQIFGLLGPNGAGKTTLMSVLTGLYQASGGNAWVDGHEIGNGETNLRVGVCPQFDLLWENMTISEHMYFYGLLKGIEMNQLQQEISSLLKDVDLLNQRDLKSSELSGGMRRRLSLAISLIGNPRVVFLDEPSSGLDPSHRRQMWDILLKCKKRTTILLTTHLMEQAQALCDRLGIINKGLLRCIGTQKELKERFGQGYRLTIHFKQWKGEPIKMIEDLVSLGCQVVNDLSSRVMLKVPKQKLLQIVKSLKKCDSLSWLLSQPSLYDVFMYFIQ